MRRLDWSELVVAIALLVLVCGMVALALRQPSNKEQAWQNLLRAQEIYREASK